MSPFFFCLLVSKRVERKRFHCSWKYAILVLKNEFSNKQKRGTSMDIDKIIKQVARAHNTTPEEVYAEMQIALDAAFQSKDPEVQKEWAKIPFKGDHPTPEDVIPYLVGRLKNPQEAVS